MKKAATAVSLNDDEAKEWLDGHCPKNQIGW